MDEPKTERPPTRRTGLRLAIVALAGVAIGVGAIYGLAPKSGNGENSCPGAADIAAGLSPLVKGDIAALNVDKAPKPLVPIAFKTPDGKPASLADLAGRTVLLNLWATWCAPCREEMPALDALQASLGGPKFEVVSVNIDQRNPDRAAAFLDDIGVKTLTRYADPTAGIFQTLKSAGLAFGMPTTLVIDGQGCVIASLAGPADWASADAKALVAEAIRRGGA